MAHHRSRVLAVLAAVASSAIVVGAPPTAPVARAADAPQLVASDGETDPVTGSGDAMDDPAIWVHPTDPSRSLVMGNDKTGGFETYDLDGRLVQRLTFGTTFWGNVDVRQGVVVNGITHDLVGVQQQGVRFYTVDPQSRLLSPVTEAAAPIGVSGEGFCLYRSPVTHRVYGISITRGGTVNEFELTDPDADGLLSSTTVRTFAVGSEAEGCVADDETGALYISEEDVALWRYSAEPAGGTTRTAVDVLTSAGGHLVPDIEGLTIAAEADGTGYLIASAQGTSDPTTSYFAVYRREGGNDFVKTVRIGDGVASDDCDHTDGVAATTAPLGPAYPSGIFVCQDNNNDLPGTSGNQDLKIVRLDHVVDLGEQPPPGPPSPISFVGQGTANANSTGFTVAVPAAVQPGDGLLLFASAGSDRILTAPGGWRQVARVVDDTHATTVWSRVAVAGDAGSAVRVTTGGTYVKVGLTLAAYRGTDTSDPLASVTGAAETATTAVHRTPTVPNATDGARRVSYWSDKTNGTTGWIPPAGEVARATTVGSGSGRVSTLLTDLPDALTAGDPASTGGLAATADVAASKATMWTILLRPAAARTPRAALTSACNGLTCTFDGSGSTGAGGVASWAWDFGDGGEAAGPVVSHTYAADGSYPVRLTVTDGTGASASTVQTLVVAAPQPSRIGFVGQATSDVNSTVFRVPTPAAVEAGDTLLLFVSRANSTALTGLDPAWTLVGEVADGEVTTVWTRPALAGDAGSVVRLTSGTTYLKVAMTMAAYRGVDASAPVARASGVPEPLSTTAHRAPDVTNDVDGAWRVSYWSDKNSATTAWTAPGGETLRASCVGTGGGRVSGLLTDSGGPVVAGSTATTSAGTAIADAPTSTATMWTILLRPSA